MSFAIKYRHDPAIKKYALEMRRYFSDQLDISGLRKEFSKSPYIKGKVIVFERVNEKLETHEVQRWIPHELSPSTVEDVGTIMLIEPHKTYYGEYSENPLGLSPTYRAYVVVWDVKIVDRIRRTIIFKKTFEGEKPPSSLSRFFSGDNPIKKPSRLGIGVVRISGNICFEESDGVWEIISRPYLEELKKFINSLPIK